MTMAAAKKKPKKTVKHSTGAGKASRKSASKRLSSKAGKKRAVKRTTAKKSVQRVRSLTVDKLTAKLGADIPTAPAYLRGGNLPIALITSQYGPATKRTILAALSRLAAEGLVMIISDEVFQIKVTPPPQG